MLAFLLHCLQFMINIKVNSFYLFLIVIFKMFKTDKSTQASNKKIAVSCETFRTLLRFLIVKDVKSTDKTR